MHLSPVLDTDLYKPSHWLQYPPNTTYAQAYLEARVPGRSTMFFGLQYLLDEILGPPITKADVDEARDLFKSTGVPFNYDGWMRVVNRHEGKLPLIIKAVPEGSVVPNGNVLMTVESTDTELAWLVGWLETLLVRLWYPSTVATVSYEVRKMLEKFWHETSDEPYDSILFKLHDFGSRGVSSGESAMIGGAAHLVNFLGSDTAAGIWAAKEYYGGPGPFGLSIPAAEHSTITAWGRDREGEAYANFLEQFKDYPIIACVSDSYDLWRAVDDHWGDTLKDKVVARDGLLVIRPDSGDPAGVVMELLTRLQRIFGSTINSKGCHVLNNVRVLQGDGLTPDTIEGILLRMTSEAQSGPRFSIDNIAFGMGGGLLQKVDRDTMGFAYKHCLMGVDGEYVNVSKDPVDDPGKRSKEGDLDLIRTTGDEYATIDRQMNPDAKGLLQTVYVNGHVMRIQTFDHVRKTAWPATT